MGDTNNNSLDKFYETLGGVEYGYNTVKGGKAKKPAAKKPAAKKPDAKKPDAKKHAIKKPDAKKHAAKKHAAKKQPIEVNIPKKMLDEIYTTVDEMYKVFNKEIKKKTSKKIIGGGINGGEQILRTADLNLSIEPVPYIAQFYLDASDAKSNFA